MLGKKACGILRREEIKADSAVLLEALRDPGRLTRDEGQAGQEAGVAPKNRDKTSLCVVPDPRRCSAKVPAARGIPKGL